MPLSLQSRQAGYGYIGVNQSAALDGGGDDEHFHLGGLGAADFDFDSSGFDVDSPSRFVLPHPRRLVGLDKDKDKDNVCFASFSSSIQPTTIMTNLTSTIIFQQEEDLERNNLSMLVCSASY